MSLFFIISKKIFQKRKSVFRGMFFILLFTPFLVNAAENSKTIFSSDAVFTLSLTKTGTGNGTLTSAPVGIDCGATCTTSFTEGTVVTLTVSADAGSIFSGWSGDGDCSDGVITMNAPVSCTADFSLLYATPDLWTQVLGGSSIFHLLGNVGIGTSTPSEALEVVGKVKADELCIGSDCRSAWPVGAANTSSPVLFGAETVDQGTMAELLEKIKARQEEIDTLRQSIEQLEQQITLLEKDKENVSEGESVPE
ncbi:septum formation initiator family protein [Candidatus Peregrinibacteria bacterium]|nr:MAG: septum formation initiator family protein [Candidatus Peregrinibacteria bacterium]